MTSVLQVDSVRYSIGHKVILSDVFIECRTSDIVLITSINGGGKSSLLNAIYGFLNCEKSVRVDGVNFPNISKFPSILNFLPQSNFIPRKLTIKNIINYFNLSMNDFDSTLPHLKLKHDSKIGKISKGEQRLVEIYVVVSSKSMFTLLDEPYEFIDPLHINTINNLIIKYKSEKGFIISSNRLEESLAIATKIYLLKLGNLLHVDFAKNQTVNQLKKLLVTTQ